MRNLVDVINTIISKIPVSEVDFIQELKRVIEDEPYRAPENTVGWEKVSNILSDYLSDPKEDWEYTILSIFSTLPFQVVKSSIEAERRKKNTAF